MKTSTKRHIDELPLRRRLLAALLLLAVAAGGLWALSPGGVGTPDPVRVTDGPSAELYRTVTGDVPSGAAGAAEPVGAAALVGLGLLLARRGVQALRRRDARGVAGAVLTGAGTLTAYGLSEAVKLAVDEARPCRVLRTVAGCPEAGDWSFPSNHATLAAGLALGTVLLWPRLAALALPLAAVAAAARVLAGVHYPHDVAAGALLGAALTAAVVVALLPAAASVLGRYGDARLVRDDRRGGPVLHAQPGQQ